MLGRIIETSADSVEDTAIELSTVDERQRIEWAHEYGLIAIVRSPEQLNYIREKCIYHMPYSQQWALRLRADFVLLLLSQSSFSGSAGVGFDATITSVHFGERHEILPAPPPSGRANSDRDRYIWFKLGPVIERAEPLRYSGQPPRFAFTTRLAYREATDLSDLLLIREPERRFRRECEAEELTVQVYDESASSAQVFDVGQLRLRFKVSAPGGEPLNVRFDPVAMEFRWPPDDDGALQIMYGIDGRRDLTEILLEELSGYAGAHPVRTGNGAFDQRQNDVFGAALDSVLLHTRRSQRLPRRLWPLIESQAECAKAVWRNPDQGIWEARGKPQHYVSSKLMCWVAMDRAAKLADIRGDRDLATAWTETAAEIKADILAHGVDKRGVLCQHYDTESLDASTLLAALFGFLAAEDPRLKASVLAIADELTENGFVLRYRTDETDDGLSGKEGTFVICSFWLVSALAIVGEMQRARDLMERLAKVASPLGLYAEEFDVETGRHLGNFPQAFSHLAAVEAAGRIVLADRLAEITG